MSLDPDGNWHLIDIPESTSAETVLRWFLDEMRRVVDSTDACANLLVDPSIRRDVKPIVADILRSNANLVNPFMDKISDYLERVEQAKRPDD